MKPAEEVLGELKNVIMKPLQSEVDNLVYDKIL